jgi:hypothetical protein
MLKFQLTNKSTLVNVATAIQIQSSKLVGPTTLSLTPPMSYRRTDFYYYYFVNSQIILYLSCLINEMDHTRTS